MSEDRMLVTMTDEAREFLYSSGPESAKFPQALAEVFQQAELSVTIMISLVDKSLHFATIEDGQLLIKTQVDPVEEKKLPVLMPSFVVYTNADDVKQLRMGNVYGFSALKTALEYVRLYRQHYRSAA